MSLGRSTIGTGVGRGLKVILLGRTCGCSLGVGLRRSVAGCSVATAIS